GTAPSVDQAHHQPHRGVGQRARRGVVRVKSACTAVGRYNNGSTLVTLDERWNGTMWSIERTKNPAGGSNRQLSGVSCASNSACNAVGFSSNGTLAERWKGTMWSIKRTPNPVGGLLQ